MLQSRPLASLCSCLWLLLLLCFSSSSSSCSSPSLSPVCFASGQGQGYPTTLEWVVNSPGASYDSSIGFMLKVTIGDEYGDYINWNEGWVDFTYSEDFGTTWTAVPSGTGVMPAFDGSSTASMVVTNGFYPGGIRLFRAKFRPADLWLYNPSTSAAKYVNILPARTSVNIGASDSTAYVRQNFHLVAYVTPDTAAGYVTFTYSDGSVVAGTGDKSGGGTTTDGSQVAVVLTAAGKASYTVSGVGSKGTRNFLAVFTPTNSLQYAASDPALSGKRSVVIVPIPTRVDFPAANTYPPSFVGAGTDFTMQASVYDDTTSSSPLGTIDFTYADGSVLPTGQAWVPSLGATQSSNGKNVQINSGGMASFTLTPGGLSPGGPRYFIARFNPADNNVWDSSVTATPRLVTVNAVVTSVAWSADAASSARVGQDFLLKVSVSPSNAPGSITFSYSSDGSTVLGTGSSASGGSSTNGVNVALSSGVASYTVTGLLAPLGAKNFLATFVPASSVQYASSFSSSRSVTLRALDTSVAFSSASSSQTVAAGVDFVLEVQVTPASVAGSVTFTYASNGALVGAPVAVNGAGVAALTVGGLNPGGLRTFSASFVPVDQNTYASSSTDWAAAVTVLPVVTTMQLTISPSPATATDILQLTATFTGSAASLASGSVQFQFSDGSAVATVGEVFSTVTKASSDSVLTLALRPLVIGSYEFKAVFTPSASNQYASCVSTAQVSVTAALTTVTFSAASVSQSVAAGSDFVLVVQVSPASAAGRVAVADVSGGASVGAPVVLSGGVASITVSGLTPGGLRNFRASFAPTNTAVYAGSSTAQVASVTVQPEATSMQLTISPSSGTATATDILQLNATFTGSPASLLATGSVQFQFSDGSAVAAVGEAFSTVTKGSSATFVTLALRPLVVGSYEFKAIFTPDASDQYASCVSNAAPVSVSAALTLITFDLDSLSQSVAAGVDFVLGVDISPSSAAGVVTFTYASSGAAVVGFGRGADEGVVTDGARVAVRRGGASYTVSAITPGGARQFSAVFTPTNTRVYANSSTTQVATVTVEPVATSMQLTISPSSGAATATDILQLNATFTGGTAASLLATGSVQFQFSDGSAVAAVGEAFSTVTKESGATSVSLSIRPLVIGSYELQAVFTPDASDQYNACTSNAAQVSVAAAPTTVAFSALTANQSVAASVDFALAVQVTPASAAGLVAFVDASSGASVGIPVAVSGGGAASITVSGLTPGGLRSFSASFTPTLVDVYANSSTAQVAAVTVQPVSTSLLLTASPSAPTAADIVELTATFVGSPASLSAVGSVRFLFNDGSAVLAAGEGSSTVAKAASAAAVSVNASALAVGSYEFKAVFTPAVAEQYGASTSNTAQVNVAAVVQLESSSSSGSAASIVGDNGLSTVTDSSSSSSSSLGVILGAVLGSVAALGLLSGGVYLYRARSTLVPPNGNQVNEATLPADLDGAVGVSVPLYIKPEPVQIELV